MKKLLILMVLSILTINQAFAFNKAFRATFVNELPEEKEISEEINDDIVKISLNPTFTLIQNKDEDAFSLRELSKKTTCLKDQNGVENCSENLVQCNQEFNKDSGFSVEHKKRLLINKIKSGSDYICPKGFTALDNLNTQSSLCKKDYKYYTYECSTSNNAYAFPWLGPIVKTGADCLGQCGPDGCVCNPKTPPVGNCIQETAKCPFDSNKKCTQIKSDKDTRNKTIPLTIFSLGDSEKIVKKLKKEVQCKGVSIYDKKLKTCASEPFVENGNILSCSKDSYLENGTCVSEPSCESGFDLEAGECIKKYSFYQYSCPKDFEIKNKGKDCFGTCVGSNCQCNAETAPENNCFKEKKEQKNTKIKYTKTEKIPLVEVSGEFHDPFENDFVSSLTPIIKVNGKKNKLCFETEKSSGCVEVKGCLFKGEEEIKNNSIAIKKHSLGAVNTDCIVTGGIGNTINLLKALKTEGSKIIFSSEIGKNNLGHVEFISKELSQENPEISHYIKNGLHPFQANNKTYLASEEITSLEECKKLSKKLKLEMELVFKTKELRNISTLMTQNKYDRLMSSEDVRCIFKSPVKLGFYKKEKTTETLKEEGFTIFACSPFECNDGSCQKAVCKKGYDGPIQPEGTNLLDGTCQEQICDANKEYAQYCGKTQECDVSDPSIIKTEEGCKKLTCEDGELNPLNQKCEM